MNLTSDPSLSLSLFSRLALYVYEYLLHVGAQKSAQTFLSEVRRCITPCVALLYDQECGIMSCSVLKAGLWTRKLCH